MNMATPKRARNRRKSKTENKVGTNIESFVNLARKITGGSGR
jgi:hypothetical protein